MADSIAQLSFELSAKALEEQERTLAGLRACAGTVIASGSVAASFLGSAARRGLLDALGGLAMVAFVICLGSAIWVLMPHDLVFAFHGEDVMAEGRQTGLSGTSGAYRIAGVWLRRHVRANRGKLAALTSVLTLSCVFLTAEVVLWILSLVG